MLLRILTIAEQKALSLYK